MNKHIKKWYPSQLFYVGEIDKKLTFHLYLRYRNTIKEVFRETIDGTKYLAWNIYELKFMGGWRPAKETFFKEKPNLQRVDRPMPNVFIDRIFHNKLQMIKALPTLKYVYPERGYNLFRFCQVLKKYPEMELIYKNEKTRFLWNNMSFYRLGKKTRKAVVRTIIRDEVPTYAFNDLNKILFYVKHPDIETETGYYKFQLKQYFIKHIPLGLNKEYVVSRYFKQYDFSYKTVISNYEYGQICERIKDFMTTYNDYLRLQAELHRYVRENFYPASVVVAHDELVKLNNKLEEEREKKKRIKLAKMRIIRRDTVQKLQYKNKKFALYLPETQGDLFNLGKAFDNCVGSMSYGEDEKKGKCLICAVKENKKWVACVEIDTKSHKIQQIYGKHNSILKSKAPKMFINRYIKEVVSNVYC